VAAARRFSDSTLHLRLTTLSAFEFTPPPPVASYLRMSTDGPTSSNALALSAKALRTREQPISYLINVAIQNPGIVNLAAGLVDPLTLPVEETAAITQRVFADIARGRSALQYDTTLGQADLRREILKHLEKLEGAPASSLGITADDVLVTTGSQQALYLIGDTLLDPGDIVIAANPSYFVYTGALSSLGATVLTAPMDAGGMNLDAVEKILVELQHTNQLHRLKFIYCTSYFQNPTGLSLAAERRKRLYELARDFSRAHRVLILEDAAYRELRYDGDALPSIKSYDPDNQHTIISHTFSKPFAPGIKLGYTIMPRDLLDPILQQKGNHDFGSASVCQHIALEALRSGSYYTHVEKLRRSYRIKRDRTLEALDRHMPKIPGVHWTHPHGGLYVWITLPEQIDTSRQSEMFQTCLSRGVLYVPGDYCMQPDPGGKLARHHLRLSFGAVPIEKIEPGIERLAEVIREQLSAAPLAADDLAAVGEPAS
jgi:2-aminoadipate transaminase